MQRIKRSVTKTRKSSSERSQAEVVSTFLDSGKSIAEVARLYGLPEQTMRQWIRQASDEALANSSTGPGRGQVRPLVAFPEPATGCTREGEPVAEGFVQRVEEGPAAAEIAELLADTEGAARAEIAAAYAAAVEAMIRTEVAAAEAVANAQAAAAAKIAEVESAAADAVTRFDVAMAEAVARFEAQASEAAATHAEVATRLEVEIAEAQATAADAVARSELLAEALARSEAAAAEAAAVATGSSSPPTGGNASLQKGFPDRQLAALASPLPHTPYHD